MKLFTGIMLSSSMVCYLITLRMTYVAYLKADAGLAGLNDSINAVLFDGAVFYQIALLKAARLPV